MRWSDFIFIWGFAVRKIEGSPDCSEPIKSRIPSIWLSGHLGAKVTCRHQWPPGAAGAQLCHRSSERFLFNKNSGLKFWKFHSLNGIIQSAELIWPKPLNVWHRMQKSSTGDNNFVKWKGAMKWPDWSKWTIFKGGCNYSGRTEHEWSVPFDLQEKFP